MVAFFLVVAVVALPLLLLPTGKPPKPPPGPPKPTKTKRKTKRKHRLGRPLVAGEMPARPWRLAHRPIPGASGRRQHHRWPLLPQEVSLLHWSEASQRRRRGWVVAVAAFWTSWSRYRARTGFPQLRLRSPEKGKSFWGPLVKLFCVCCALAYHITNKQTTHFKMGPKNEKGCAKGGGIRL